MAMAPPFTLTRAGSMSKALLTAQACAAKASFNSNKSTSLAFQPARCKAFCDAGTGPMPMVAGSKPLVPKEAMRAKGVKPKAAAFLADMTTTAAAPSLMPEALPAVTEPALSKAGRKPAKASALVFLLMNSSVLNTTGSPLRCGMSTSTISSLNLPASCAALAFCWLPSAKASCMSREMLCALATFSAVMPM